MNDQPYGPTEAERLAGGVTITVFYDVPIDGKTSEDVVIGFIKTKDHNNPAIQAPEDNPTSFVAHCCGRNQFWGESLRMDSLVQAMKEARRINASFFELLAMKAEALEKMSPALMEKLIEAGRNAETAAPAPRIGRVTR